MNSPEARQNQNSSRRLPGAHELPLEMLKTVAENVFPGGIDWGKGGSGFMTCPGTHLHTSPNQPRDCRITLGDNLPPTVSCFHTSCKSEVEQANKALRSAIGKAEYTGEIPKRRPLSLAQGAAVQKVETALLQIFTSVPLPTEEMANPSRAFLESLFQPDDLVAIYDCRESDRKTSPNSLTKYAPGAGMTRRVAELILEMEGEGASVLDLYPNRLTLFIRANPMQPNGRSDREVATYRYVLVDIDKDEYGNQYPLEVQYGALIASKLPLASVTYSGDISLAALVRVDADNEVEYRSRRDQVYERMKQFIKIDDACGNPSRWTRFPGGIRHLGDYGAGSLHKEQRLVALNQGTACWDEFLETLERERNERRIAPLIDTNAENQGQVSASVFAVMAREEHGLYGIEYVRNKPVVNLAVVSRVLKNHPEWRGQIFYDTFFNRVYTARGTDAPVEWNDLHDSRALVWLQETFGLPNANLEDVQRAVRIVAHENQRNCLREWLQSLKWDGTHRLSDLITKGFGAEESQYHSRVGECWLISMVARAMRPGCKVDTLPVFEGEQGAGKSSGLRILGGELFTESHEQVTSKDFYSVLSGRWLVEISEMHSFNKAEVERIKGIISNQTDRYRVPYDKHASDHPRQCVFAGTTNRDDWHNDETGGRRFWPVACGVVDLQWLRENREQLFAEALFRFDQGESWWDVPCDQHREKIEDRRLEDPWTAPIARFLENRTSVSVHDVLRHGVDKLVEHQTSSDARRVAKILRDMGYEKCFERVDGAKKRMWRRKSTA